MPSKIRITGIESRREFVDHLRESGVAGDVLVDLMWYGRRIGSEFDVRSEGNYVYHVRETSARYPTVDKADAEVIE